MQKNDGRFGGSLFSLNFRKVTKVFLFAVCIFILFILIFLLSMCFGRPGTVQAKGYDALDTVLHSAVPGAMHFRQSDFEYATRLQTDAYGRCLYKVKYTTFFDNRTVAYIVTQIETKNDASYYPFCCYLLKFTPDADATTEELEQLCVDNDWGKPIDAAKLVTTQHAEADFRYLEGERAFEFVHERVNRDAAEALNLSSSQQCIADGLQLFDKDGRQVIAIRADSDERGNIVKDFTCYFALYSPMETPKVSNLVMWEAPENSRNELMMYCQRREIEVP